MKIVPKRIVQNILRRQRLLNHENFMFQRILEGMRKGIKFDSLLKLIIHSVCRGLGFKRAGIFLVETDEKNVFLALGVGPKGNLERNKDRFPLSSPPGTVIICDVITGRKKYFFSNNIPQRVPKRYVYRVPVFNNAVVPIQVGKGRIIGALAVDNLHQNRPITMSDVSSLMNYSTQVGLAIESFRIHERMVSLSLTDSLTGLYNRRFFDQALGQEIKRCHRYRRTFSLLLIDIDHFKNINDTYGHDNGDLALKQIAGILRNNVRTLDMVARIGGEEFAVLLPETPPNNISAVTRRLMKLVRNMKLVFPSANLTQRKTTISIGVAGFRRGEFTLTQVIKAADESLYQAKRRGRNRVGSIKILAK
jgi:diguanylate cyclase (GGDEF)-like protein